MFPVPAGMRRRRPYRSLIVVAAAALVAGVAAPGAAALQPAAPSAAAAADVVRVAPNPAAADVSPGMLAAMQRDLHLTADQARARLINEDRAGRLERVLRKRLGKAWAGAWISDDGKDLVVAVTDKSTAAFIRAAGAVPRVVAHSEAHLASVQDRLNRRARDPENVPAALVSWSADIIANRVVVKALPGGRAAAEAFVAAAGVRPGDVRFETARERPRPARDVQAGDRFYTAAGGCSTGFAVTRGLVDEGYITAGHCLVGSVLAYALDQQVFAQGTVAGSRYHNGSDDDGWVRTSALYRPIPRVNVYFGGPLDNRITGSDVAPVNATLCRSGGTSGWKCGRKLPGGPTTTRDEDGAVVHDNLTTSACALPGDSGGPVVWGTQAQGITIGTASACFATASPATYFQPLSKILRAYDLTLRTVSTQPPTPRRASLNWTEKSKLWDALGGEVKGKVAAVSLGPSHLQVFGRWSNDRLYTNVFDGTSWRGWQDLDGFVTEPPTAIARAGGIDVFYRGEQSRLIWRRWDGSRWLVPQVDLRGRLVGPPSAVSLNDNHMAVFARGDDDELWYKVFNGSTWTNWMGLDGDLSDPPTAIVRGNRIEVYTRDKDDKSVRYRHFNGSAWEPWGGLGGKGRGPLAVVSVNPGQVDVLQRTINDTLEYHRYADGRWATDANGNIGYGWRGMGGDVKGPPTAVTGPGNQIRAFTRDGTGQVNMVSWMGHGIHWQDWTALDGETTEPVGAAVRSVTDQASLIDAVAIDRATGMPFHTSVDGLPPVVRVTTNSDRYTVGDAPYYTVTGPPGAKICWSSTKDGVPTGENDECYGHVTDSNGIWAGPGGGWEPEHVGSWTKQVRVGDNNPQTAQVSFTVAYPPVALAADKASYQVGESITYMVTGPPHTPICWSSWRDGASTGEVDACYGHMTDAYGRWSATAADPWTEAHLGSWVKQARVGTETSQVSFEVVQATPD